MTLCLFTAAAALDQESQFGIEPKYVILQVLSFLLILALISVPLVLAFKASIKSARTFDGYLAIAWILLCWFLPIIGPIAAFVAIKKHTNTVPPTSVS